MRKFAIAIVASNKNIRIKSNYCNSKKNKKEIAAK